MHDGINPIKKTEAYEDIPTIFNYPSINNDDYTSIYFAIHDLKHSLSTGKTLPIFDLQMILEDIRTQLNYYQEDATKKQAKAQALLDASRSLFEIQSFVNKEDPTTFTDHVKAAHRTLLQNMKYLADNDTTSILDPIILRLRDMEFDDIFSIKKLTVIAARDLIYDDTYDVLDKVREVMGFKSLDPDLLNAELEQSSVGLGYFSDTIINTGNPKLLEALKNLDTATAASYYANSVYGFTPTALASIRKMLFAIWC